MNSSQTSQVAGLGAISTNANVRVKQMAGLLAYAPPATLETRMLQSAVLIAYSAGTENVTTNVSQVTCLVAYDEQAPGTNRQEAWTFILDGHRFYVLPLGEEGDWAYDTTTQEWCQLQTQGFDGMNFTKGVMWGIRIIGGDSLYPVLDEMDPNQPLDDGWRPIERVVTGGIPTRGRYTIGVANFSLTASVGDDASVAMPISLAFSDDNGVTWSQEFPIPLTDVSTQLLIWNALGSFAAPGRIFRITDYAGPVRLDGADCVLTVSSGADSAQEQEGQVRR
jgi:hypothetical protein